MPHLHCNWSSYLNRERRHLFSVPETLNSILHQISAKLYLVLMPQQMIWASTIRGFQELQIEWNMSSMSTRQNTSPWTVSINIKCHSALVPASQAILNIQEGSLTYTPFATELKGTHLPFFVVMHDRVYVLGNQFKTKPVLSTAITIGNFSPTSLFRKRTSPISRQSFHTVRTFYLMFTR